MGVWRLSIGQAPVGARGFWNPQGPTLGRSAFMPLTAVSPRWIVALLIAAIAGVFALDVLTPAGIGEGIGYAAVMTLCLWLPGRNAVLVAAAVCTALTIAAHFLGPQGDAGQLDCINRLFVLAAIWAIAALVHQRMTARGAEAAAEPSWPGAAAPVRHTGHPGHEFMAGFVSRAAGLCVAILGIAVLTGWALNIPSLTTVIPGFAAMRPITATAFVFAGSALFLTHIDGARGRWAARSCAALAGLIGLLTLADYASPSFTFGVDRWLYTELTAPYGAAAPQWQMSYFASSSFTLFAFVLLTLETEAAWLRRLLVAAGAMGQAMAALAVLGYIYDVNSLYQFMGTAPTALHTASAFFVLFTAAALAAPERGWVAMLSGESVGKAMMRRLLLATVAIPLLAGFLITHLARDASIAPNFGIAILALCTVVFLAIVIWRSTRMLDQLDADRRTKEAALRTSQAMLATAENVAGVGSWEWDIADDRLIWSEEHLRLFGYPADPKFATNENWLARVHADDKARVQRETDAAMEGESPYDIDYRIVLPDGTERIIHSKGEVFRDGNGKAVRMVGTVHDITERKRAEDALQHQLNLLATITDNATEAIFLCASGARLTFMNRAAERMFGWRQEEILGQVLHDALHYKYPDGRPYPISECPFFRVFATLEPLTNREDKWVRRDGSFVDVSCSVAPIIRGGQAVGFVLVMHDITERKRAEEALRESEDQLRQAQKMEAVGQLTGGIAHDFNNLLSVVIGNLELILDRTEDNAALGKLAQAALDGSLRGAELTQRLLAFSRKQTLQPKVIDLGARLPAISTLLQRALGEQINVVIHAAADLWAVRIDPSQLDDSILNLALNARDAMPKGGTLTIEAANVRLDADAAADVAAGDYVLVTVTDTGTGMTPDVMERVFEPFFTTKGVGAGSGLGLSMVYGFVKQSKGHIKIYSEPGFGTAVNIYLPRAEAAGADETAPAAADVAADVASRGELILVVEDNETVRSVVVTQLRELGYRTLEADSGEEALALLNAQGDVDLVFSDVVMRGGIDGYELARQARARFDGLKILLMSGFTMKSVAEGFEGAEGFELLKKPYRKQDLAQKLRAILVTA